MDAECQDTIFLKAIWTVSLWENGQIVYKISQKYVFCEILGKCLALLSFYNF